jgi:hypothetical protein
MKPRNCKDSIWLLDSEQRRLELRVRHTVKSEPVS